VPGAKLAFNKPFFKEFTLRLPGAGASLLQRLLAKGYHAGLHLGRWYPQWPDCVTIAVTEKRTKAEIDGLVEAYRHAT
jgi:glycine dehydrogenase subunit 1